MSSPISDLEVILQRQRAGFIADGPPTADVRRRRIDLLLSALTEGAESLASAIHEDFGTRARGISLSSDILGSVPDIAHTRARLERWMKPATVSRAARLAGIHASVRPHPLGVVGIVAPWNFPVQLAAVPAASALAAGNRAMIKMSEKTPATAEMFASLIARRFDPDVLHVVTGGLDVAEAFSGLALDHLFFTGSPSVGRRVMRSAAENLVPVTLELGGKNPAVVGPGAHLARAADRIARARLANGGQICLCPDYAFVPSRDVDAFVGYVADSVRKAYPQVLSNPGYCSLVDEASFDRVVALIDDARAKGASVIELAPAGEALPDRPSRKIAMTVVTGVTDEMAISHEEVFGPVLAVHAYSTLDDVIDYINARSSPLAAYWYGPADSNFESFCQNTRSGGVSRNDFALHASLASLPFGGVGDSGMGAYHGKAGFDTFTHRRSIVESDLPFNATTSSVASTASATALIAGGIRLYSRVIRRRLGSTR